MANTAIAKIAGIATESQVAELEKAVAELTRRQVAFEKSVQGRFVELELRTGNLEDQLKQGRNSKNRIAPPSILAEEPMLKPSSGKKTKTIMEHKVSDRQLVGIWRNVFKNGANILIARDCRFEADRTVFSFDEPYARVADSSRLSTSKPPPSALLGDYQYDNGRLAVYFVDPRFNSEGVVNWLSDDRFELVAKSGPKMLWKRQR